MRTDSRARETGRTVLPVRAGTDPAALAGFINKVKKIAECVCVQCGKLKISPHEDPRLNDAVRFVRDPKKRLAIVHALVKGKMTCDMDVMDEETQAKIAAGEDVPKGHGGCGHDQPVLRREGLKLFLQYGRGKDEVSDPRAYRESRVTRGSSRRTHSLLARSPLRTATRSSPTGNPGRRRKRTPSSARSRTRTS